MRAWLARGREYYGRNFTFMVYNKDDPKGGPMPFTGPFNETMFPIVYVFPQSLCQCFATLKKKTLSCTLGIAIAAINETDWMIFTPCMQIHESARNEPAGVGVCRQHIPDVRPRVLERR
jgi:hypothetical protein